MTESTSEYKKRIKEIKQSIENEPYMAKMREDIAEGIFKTGIRQATVEEQFQAVIDETTGKDVISAPEIILARNGEADLKTRLDKEHQEVTAQLAQTELSNKKAISQIDFVEMVKSHTSYTRLRARRSTANTYQVCLDNGENHVTYEFKKDTNDDFIKLNCAFIGKVEAELSSILATDLTGTWNTANQPFYYTTNVGATFKVSNVEGSKLKFKHRTDNRGGIFEFVIDGDTSNPITISTWSEIDSGTTVVESVIAENLTDGPHNIVATFKGSDPNNPPNGGTARGWVNGTNDLSAGTVAGYDQDEITQDTILLANESNKEIAINIAYQGVNRFNPDHGEGTTFNNAPPEFLIDGKEVSLTNKWVEGAKFQLRQDNYIEYPEFEGTHLAKLFMTATIGLDGVFDYNGFVQSLVDCTFNLIYPLMLPTNFSTLNRAVTSYGNSKTSNNSGDNHYFSEENEETISAAMVHNSNVNLVVAGTITSPVDTMRIGKINHPSDGVVRFWERSNSPKIYFGAGELVPMMAGESYRWGGKIVAGEVKKIMAYIKG